MVNFFPSDDQWQKTKSVIFDIHVKNINDIGRKRKMKITAEPGKIANMRGEGTEWRFWHFPHCATHLYMFFAIVAVKDGYDYLINLLKDTAKTILAFIW